LTLIRTDMQIILNGQAKSLDRQTSLSNLLNLLNLNPDTMAAEINGRIIEPDRYSLQELRNDDRVELIRFVGGG